MPSICLTIFFNIYPSERYWMFQSLSPMHWEGLKALWSHYTGTAHELPMVESLARWWQVGATKVVASWCHPPAPSIAGDWRAAAAACMPCPVCPPPPLGLLDMSAQLTPAGRHPPTLPWLSHLVLLLLLVHNLTLHQLTKSASTTCLKVSPTHKQGAQRRKASQPLQWPSPTAGGTTRATRARQIRESDLQTTNHQTQRPQTWPAHQLIKERDELRILNPNKYNIGEKLL